MVTDASAGAGVMVATGLIVVAGLIVVTGFIGGIETFCVDDGMESGRDTVSLVASSNDSAGVSLDDAGDAGDDDDADDDDGTGADPSITSYADGSAPLDDDGGEDAVSRETKIAS